MVIMAKHSQLLWMKFLAGDLNSGFFTQVLNKPFTKQLTRQELFTILCLECALFKTDARTGAQCPELTHSRQGTRKCTHPKLHVTHIRVSVSTCTAIHTHDGAADLAFSPFISTPPQPPLLNLLADYPHFYHFLCRFAIPYVLITLLWSPAFGFR